MKIPHYTNIFLDRDGVVNEVVMRGNVISSPRTRQEFIVRPDFLRFAKLVDRNTRFFLVTNQPDISRNLLTWSDLDYMHRQVSSILSFDEIFVCPHDDFDNCLCRKPRPGMIIEALGKYNLDPSDCIMIGDSFKDIKAADAAGISSILLATNYNQTLAVSKRIVSLESLLV